jgi:hypothetical protein
MRLILPTMDNISEEHLNNLIEINECVEYNKKMELIKKNILKKDL